MSRGRPPTWLVVVGCVTTVLVLAGAVGLGGWLIDRRVKSADPVAAPDTGLSLPDEARQALASGPPLVRRILSYGYTTFDANVAAAHAVMTDNYRPSYDQTILMIRQRIIAGAVSVSTKPVTAGVVSWRTGRADLLVFVEQTTVALPSKTPQIQRVAVRLTVVRQSETWLVDGMEVITGEAKADASASWPGPSATAALTAARSCVTGYMTLDYRTIDRDQRRALTCATGEFHSRYRQSQGQLRRLAVDQQVQTSVRGLTIGAISVTDGRIRFVVAVSITTRRANQSQEQTRTDRMTGTLTRIGQTWLISSLVAI